MHAHKKERVQSNKPHADWTYLIMKVRTSVRTNEWTNEQTNKRTNERTKKRYQYCFCAKKNNEICGKSPKKICRNSDFQHISGKVFFSEIGLGHVLSIAKTHFKQKNQRKLMTKSRENAKKPFFFSAYFQHFRPEKYVFQKSGSVTF